MTVIFISMVPVETAIEGEDNDARGGDVVPVNGRLHHKPYSEGGVTFMEVVAPVPSTTFRTGLPISCST
jgi:hypothetical protein